MVWLVSLNSCPAKSYKSLTGVTKAGKNGRALKIYSTYADLMAQSQQPERKLRFPHLVSFIGQTSMDV